MTAIRAGLGLLALLLVAGPALAQQPGGKPTAPPPIAAPAPKADGLAEVRSRIAQIEEQLVDMQVLIGTLESLARGGRGGGPGPVASAGGRGQPPGVAADGPRVRGLETQVRALTFQVEQLRAKIRQLEGGAPRTQGSAAPGPGRPAAPPIPPAAGGFRAEVRPSAPPIPPGAAAQQPPRDAIGGLLQKGTNGSAGAAPRSVATQPGGSAQEMYDTALNHMLQYDYGAARAAFEDFLKRYPRDERAPKAQFWLGESYFMRKQYRPAAEAFLKGYQTYAKSPRAPHSLLRLAMSLQRLGQKAGACATFAELSSKYPAAPTALKQEARAERRKAGC